MRKQLVAVALLILAPTAQVWASEALARSTDLSGIDPAYFCASLMSSERQPRETDEATHAQRLSDFGLFVNRFGASKWTAARQFSPFLAAPVYPERFAVSQTLIGAEAINSYVDDVTAEARRLGAEHPTGKATQPFDFKFRPLVRATQLGLSSGLFAFNLGLAWKAVDANQPVLAVLASGLAGLVAVRQLIPTLRALHADWQNGGFIEDFKRGQPGLALGLDPRRQREFERQVNETLAWIRAGAVGVVDESSPGGIRQVYVDLPMSRSTALSHGRHGEAPLANEIIAAVRRSGDGVRPVDPRQIKLSFLLYLDEKVSEPVLMVFGRSAAGSGSYVVVDSYPIVLSAGRSTCGGRSSPRLMCIRRMA